MSTTSSDFPSATLLRHVGAPVVVASFMRSGTHLTIDTLRNNFDCFSTWKFPLENNSYLYADLDVYINPVSSWQRAGLRARLLRPSRPIFKCHWALSHWAAVKQAHPQLSAWIEDQGKILLVVRDPRKILLSNIAWNVSSGVSTAKLDLPSEAVSLLARLEQRWHQILTAGVAPVHILDASKLPAVPSASLKQVAQFLDASLSQVHSIPPPLQSIRASRIQRLVAMKPASTAILTNQKPSEFAWLLDTQPVRNALADLFAKTEQFPFLAHHI
jgi:hypothetical protein